ncbi:hypothetical protein RRV45_19795 [Bacillus sp. DTU_2020_1000418_1_SI_GHA_SEK_038]|uniref:hypothetical protein n=1 Tax=Bacillus sp. DTU_2020_1000418_1_SI_GHA_SEK_038 TaxID=3077585 RepID=UPI0028EFF941|nr:hypothetical protein [Bacillus sp. DTU_2020_1000418_1_SI_GHA_SEK_038]WNS75095.1 hypothetical protein RRV45_19795 [Bacillus sp. DTU_2020_1000418_1_SI_GHA_SEK_038]
MQVNNQSTIPVSIQNETPLSLKEGDVFQAIVKEKLPNNEAILQIKGQELRAKFQGSYPSNGRIAVEITDTTQQLPIVKQIPNQNIIPPKTSSLPEGLNINSDTKAILKKAIAILKMNNMPVSKNTLMQLSAFIEKGSGTINQKLETIASMAKKKLEFTAVHIKSVHEALHGKAKISDFINEVVTKRGQTNSSIPNILKENASSQEMINQIRRALQSSNIEEATKVKAMLQKGESIQSIVHFLKGRFLQEGILSNQVLAGTESTTKVEASTASSLLNGLNNIDDQPKQTTDLEAIKKAINKEPDIQKIIMMLRKDVEDSFPPNQKNNILTALSRAEQLADAGRELAARQELLSMLNQVAKEGTFLQQEVQSAKETYQINDDFIATLPIQSKDYIVSRITEKLSQMAIDFKNTKRDITRNLQAVETLITQHKQLARTQVKPLLESTIKQLDNAILKSDMMLYTDMATEKKLLKASSQLAEAKKLLEKGDYNQASRVVHEVKDGIEKLIFKPSDTRMQHFVSKELLQLEQPSLSSQLAKSLDSSMTAVREHATGRQVFEHLRSLGMTYESEQAFSLLSKGQADEGADSSLKNALLRLAQSSQEQPLSQKAEQTITQLTGQQLLSKTDSSSLQSMMFTLPFLLKDQAEQVKVFINSKNEQQKVDWENCSLYFLIETKKLGDVGILLSSVERTLSITVKNDKADFKEKIEPIALMAKERLKEIGYNIGSIQFTNFTEEKRAVEEKKEPSKSNIPKFTERGYDFTV